MITSLPRQSTSVDFEYDVYHSVIRKCFISDRQSPSFQLLKKKHLITSEKNFGGFHKRQ